MKNTDFVVPYADSLPKEQIHKGSYSQHILDAQDWSHQFGRLLHGHLAEALLVTNPLGRAYAIWLIDALKDLRMRGEVSDADRGRIINETNFHYLNRSMSGMWMPVAEGQWQSEEQRHAIINRSREDIAIEGMTLYMLRKMFVEQEGSAALFEEQNKIFANSLSGALQEYDCALVLLDVVRKHPGWTVVPAPLQFERGVESARNIDFLIIDTLGKCALGVQMKTNVTQATSEKYDEARIVLIDGSVDFDNIKAVRTKRNSSDERVVPWPGILSTNYLQNLMPKGRGMSPAERTRLMRNKLIAKQVLAGIKTDYRAIVKRIDERVSKKI